ncbi:protein ALWAYS EARLY 3 isoform X2 [Oryza sativa Japonica Group]|uniref:protein ALWAYS EARLY 3 isoform X2 n=1 Tax=Oryza sativa subsp. japonica TaxID=39947 RepID=UPI00000A9890|nr:protein ALWAYS EARLY 2 isoform X2 [Oryza sativa Japonica Group]
MGPAKGSRTITKITIKGYDDRQHDEDPNSSSKVKLKKRKMSDLGPQWSKDELMRFYEAYRRHGKNWKKVSASVGGKSADTVEALYSVHRTFLSLPEREGTAMGFVALVTGHHNVSDESKSHKGSDQTVRASGKVRKREATGQKEKEAPHAHRSYHERRTSGLSSFKKRYYGELVKNIPRHPSGKRTPRVPVIFPADMNVAHAGIPETENAINCTKKASGATNNELECSSHGSPGISESAKFVQGQTFLEAKGTGSLKKRRIEQSMEQGQTIKDEHKTAMVAKEGNDLTEYQRLTNLFSPDEMLVLDVLESLVTVPSKISEPKINIPSGTLGRDDSALSHRREEGPSVKRSKQGKQVGECSASKTRNKRRKKLIAEEVPTEGVTSNHLDLPEERQVDATECALNSDLERGTVDLPESTANISTKIPDLPSQLKPEINMSRRSKRKSKSPCGSKYVVCNGADNLQARRLQHCLSSESLRRWCTYEWFYSAVDYPWFMDNEFVNYLNFANLSHLSRLTRSEWSTIRSSLGKPRRFSDHFLAAEKDKLENYRKKVRQYYALLSEDSWDSLPPDLARPFSIGQQVIVRHPSTRELCDGKVVMMEQDRYNVQFDRPDLGVDEVKDTDCMPVNWLDNLPDDLKKRSFLSNNSHNRVEVEQIPKFTSKENWDHISGEAEPSKTMHITSDEQVEIAVDIERLSNKSTSGNCGPLQPLQSVDDNVRSRGLSEHRNGHNDELDSYITSFVQMSLAQAKQMVDEAMKEISENGKSSLEETGISNEATDCTGPEPESAANSELPRNLIFNCIATLLAIKHFSEGRHPPPNIAGVLERACLMLRPSCAENLPIYNEIENFIAVIKNQILALVPSASSNARLPMYM